MALRWAVKLLVACVLFLLKCITDVHCENANTHKLDENHFPAELQLISTKDQTIRVGERLVLNCSLLLRANNVSTVYEYQLAWFHGAQELTNATRKLGNGTIQLVVDHVSWNNDGTYVCRDTIKKINVEPVKVHVKVGDIPSTPRDVWVNNVDFQTQIHWTSPKHSGHLPLRYVVKAQCKNETIPDIPHCQSDFFIVCDNSNSHPVTRSYPLKWSCEAEGGLLFPFSYVVYKLFVEVSNYLGSNQSKAVVVKANRINPLLTTPLPAKSFSAKEMSQAGTIRLSWETEASTKDPQPYLIKYTILYHRDGDISHNQTVTAHFPQTSHLISGLAGFSTYHFYLRIQYGKRHTDKYGSFGQAVACSLRTRISAPSEPPNITNCSKWSNHSTFLGLTVTWKNPPPETLNGPVKNMVFNSSCQPDGDAARASHQTALNFTTSVTELTSINVTIPAHELANRCAVWMSICNGPELCSADSNTCFVKNIKDIHPLWRSSPTSNHTTIIIVIVFGALIGLVLFGAIFWCLGNRRQNNTNEPREPLLSILPLEDPHNYELPVEEPVENDYNWCSALRQ